jgi:hypothetical protein
MPITILSEELVDEILIEHVPLRALARLALVNVTWTEHVKRSISLPSRWTRSHRFVEAVEAATLHKDWLRLIEGIHDTHVELDPRLLDRCRDVNALLTHGSWFRDGSLIPRGLPVHKAVFITCELPRAESVGLRELLDALALRLTPSQYVDLLATLGQTALGSQWPEPHEYVHFLQDGRVWHARGTARLDISLLEGASRPYKRREAWALPCCHEQSQWTPMLVAQLNTVLHGDGVSLSDFVNALCASHLNGAHARRCPGASTGWLQQQRELWRQCATVATDDLDVEEMTEFLVSMYVGLHGGIHEDDALPWAAEELGEWAGEERFGVPLVCALLRAIDAECEKLCHVRGSHMTMAGPLHSSDCEPDEDMWAPCAFIEKWAQWTLFPIGEEVDDDSSSEESDEGEDEGTTSPSRTFTTEEVRQICDAMELCHPSCQRHFSDRGLIFEWQNMLAG